VNTESNDFNSERLKARERAIDILKTIPAFSSVQIEVIEAGEKIAGSMPSRPALPSSERLEYAIRLLDARCAGYVKLVSDIITQEAFAIVLREFVIRAWEEYTGVTGIEPLPGNVQFSAIEERARHWTKESYRRVVRGSANVEPANKAERTAFDSDRSTGRVEAHPRVFISYSQDKQPASHCDDVHSLANKLRTEGVDVMIDRYESFPKEGWPPWMLKQIRESDFVLCVCTSTYRDRFENRAERKEGKGARFEGFVITNEVYQQACEQDKFVPVLLNGAAPEDIPVVLQNLTHYRIPEQYEALYARLTGQSLHPKPRLGNIRKSSSAIPKPQVPLINMWRIRVSMQTRANVVLATPRAQPRIATIFPGQE